MPSVSIIRYIQGISGQQINICRSLGKIDLLQYFMAGLMKCFQKGRWAIEVFLSQSFDNLQTIVNMFIVDTFLYRGIFKYSHQTCTTILFVHIYNTRARGVVTSYTVIITAVLLISCSYLLKLQGNDQYYVLNSHVVN